MAPGPSSSPPPTASAIHPPPAKRPKLAPNPISPSAMSTPQYSPSPVQQYAPGLPQHGVQQHPPLQPPQGQQQFVPQQYGQQQAPAQQPLPQYHQQQQYLQHQQLQQQHHHQQQQQQHATTSMPPPTAPASKPTDPSDLADALTSAGIDLKAEEAQLLPTSAGPGPPAVRYNIYTGMPADMQAQEERRHSEIRAQHLNSPFLVPQVLSNRLHNKTSAENCTPFSLSDGMGNVTYQGQNADIVTLLSLACRERLNSLLTRSTALAKVRRRPQMLIAGEWAEHIKDVTPELKPASAVSPVGSTLKRSFSVANNLTSSVPNSSLIPTVSLQNETAKALRALKQREWEQDQERQRKKARREQGVSGVSGPGPATTPGTDASAPGTPAGGDASGEKKMTAKESRKQQASKIEEAASHRAANATANMMMGGFGGSFGSKKKKKTYSWMNAGGAAAPGAQPMGIGSPRPAGVTGAADNGVPQTGASDNLQWTGQRLGVWREDMERGKGIQIRDWVGSLEGDGRAGAKSVYKAYLRMK